MKVQRDTIEPADLPLGGAPPAATPRKPATLEQMEREMILKVLAEASGQQPAAEILGISLRTLGRKLKQYQNESTGKP